MLVEAPEGYEPREPPIFDGGGEDDRRALLERYFAFRIANTNLDNDALRGLWSAESRHVFFNTNGHAYHGLEDWLKIWDHYRTRLRLLPAPLGAIRITVRADMALVTDDHAERRSSWSGEATPGFLLDRPYVRATIVWLKQAGQWRAIHAHFSSGRTGLRPDQGGPE